MHDAARLGPYWRNQSHNCTNTHSHTHTRPRKIKHRLFSYTSNTKRTTQGKQGLAQAAGPSSNDGASTTVISRFSIESKRPIAFRTRQPCRFIAQFRLTKCS
jgi:hypothetical protein